MLESWGPAQRSQWTWKGPFAETTFDPQFEVRREGLSGIYESTNIVLNHRLSDYVA